MPTAAEWVAKGSEPAPAPDPTPTPPVTPDPAPVETPAPATPPAEAPTPAEIEALEAFLDPEGKQKLSVPMTARWPVKIDGKEAFATTAEMHRAFQTGKAQAARWEEIAEQRRQHERDVHTLAVERKIQAAERAMVAAELDKYKAAQGDPDAMERLAADQERLRSDPEFRKDREDALRARLGDIRVEAEQELTQIDRSQTIADEGRDYITRVAAQYPGVDPADIQALCSRMLLTGEMTIGPAEGQFNARTVDQFFQREAAKLKSAAAPALAELEGLRKRLEALEAEKQNGKVIAALQTPTTPATGAPSPRSPAPPTGTGLPVPKPGETLDERGRAWARKGA